MPKLEAIGIKNFRSIAQAFLPNLAGLTVLIGINNSGKSNIIDAIKTILTVVKSDRIAGVLPQPIHSPEDVFLDREEEAVLWASFALDSSFPTETLPRDIRERVKNPNSLVISINIKKVHEKLVFYISSFSFGSLSNTIALGHEARPVYVAAEAGIEEALGRIAIETKADKDGRGKDVFLPWSDQFSSVREILTSVDFIWIPERRGNVGPTDAEQFFRLKNLREHRNTYTKLQQAVGQLHKVKVDSFQSQSALEVFFGDHSAEANGSGIHDSVKLLLALKARRTDIALIEEPETHLHSQAQYDLLEHLKEHSKNQQILITTHSSCFLDGSNANIYLVQKSESESTVNQLGKESLESLVGHLGLRYSQVFFREGLVFVEGKLDKEVLLALSTKLGTELQTKNLEFILMQGVRNLAYYASKSILDLLSRHQLKYHFVIDRDERSDEEIESLKKLVGEEHITVLGRREMENYFLDLSLITRFIKSKKDGNYETASIGKALETVGSSLKPLLVAKRVSRRINQIMPIRQEEVSKVASQGPEALTALMQALGERQELFQSLQEQLGTLWAEELKKLEGEWDIVSTPPGSELLDGVCKLFGIRFNKEKGDTLRMANLIQVSEIPEDLRLCIDTLNRLV